ncbi:MAG: helix-turn-helix domain-containing protein [Alphaproteobacteria bacterium]|nr:helix-turn-helix domain-containing protein [Alphaproteobacteria bacterium]
MPRAAIRAKGKTAAGQARATPLKPSQPTERDARLFVASVEKALLMLGAFDGERGPLSIADLASTTGIGRSAAQRFAYTLHALGYLRRDETTRRYSLAPRLLSLSRGYLSGDPLLEHAAPVISGIARESGEAASLSQLDGTDIVVVLRVPSQHVLALNVMPGARYPAYCSSPGRAMLAALPERDAAEIIARSDRQRFTPSTIVSPERLAREIERARRQGYALANQELYAGSLSVAVAVLDAAGRPAAALNIFCPSARWSAERVRARLVPLLRAGAAELSATMRPGGQAIAAGQARH